MDHNSLFYYKYFWDTAAPLLYKMALLNHRTAEERYNSMAENLRLDFDKPLMKR
jgi:hypothetical protein